MDNQSLKEIAQNLRQKTYSSVELTTHYLNKIKKHTHLNAFIHTDEEGALESAKVADALIQQQKAQTLTGIPMAHKDLFCTERLPTTCASKMLAHYRSPFNATLVQNLFEQGVVMLGKTNMDEFAMGSGNENSHFGPVKNPWDLTRVPGGSSGGSAAAVAANLAPFATGSDTGGSIRQPAAWCGISGIKPTYGRISRFGMVAYASSLDQAGPMARSVEDLAIVLEAMEGFDPLDSTSLNHPKGAYSQAIEAKLPSSLRIGLPKAFMSDELSPAVRHAMEHAITLLEKEGIRIVPIDFSYHRFAMPCYYIIACAEASSNLSRYDGIRFGHRADVRKHLHDFIAKTRQEGFGMEVKRRILLGTHVLSSGYFDAYYVQAQKVRRLIQNELMAVFKNVDCIIGPTTPNTATQLKATVSGSERYLSDLFTVPANLAGLPALSIPIGFNAENLPIGMQLMGPHLSEARLFQIAHRYQQLTDWHRHTPPQGDDL